MSDRVDLVPLRGQVKRLAAKHKITLDWSPIRHGAAGMAFVPERRVVTRYIRSIESYACAMHELGHVLCGYSPPREGSRGFSCSKRLEAEALAWDWALQNMPRKVAHSRSVTVIVMVSLAHYLYWAHCNTKTLPPDDAMFWRLLRLDWPGIYWPEKRPNV